MWYSVKNSLPVILPVAEVWQDETSKPVLIFDKFGNKKVAIFTRFDRDEPFKWKTCCSEGWDITDSVLYWADLPENPIMKLYELCKGTRFMLADDDTMQVFTFSKVDGMYSVCFNSDGDIVHIKAYADVVMVVG